MTKIEHLLRNYEICEQDESRAIGINHIHTIIIEEISCDIFNITKNPLDFRKESTTINCVHIDDLELFLDD